MTILMRFRRLQIYRGRQALKAGGVGIRYTCIVDGQESHLYYEDNNLWFMEER